MAYSLGISLVIYYSFIVRERLDIPSAHNLILVSINGIL